MLDFFSGGAPGAKEPQLAFGCYTHHSGFTACQQGQRVKGWTSKKPKPERVATGFPVNLLLLRNCGRIFCKFYCEIV